MAQQNMQGGLPGREFDAVIKFNTDAMSGMMRGCGSMLEQWNRLNADTMKFCAARWKEDLEVPARLARSQAPGDIAAIYAGFARKMFDDYSDQTRRVMDFVGAMGRETVEADADDQAAAAEEPAEETAPAKAAEPKAEGVAVAAKAEAAVEPVEKPAASSRSATAKPAVVTRQVRAETKPAKAKPAPSAGRQAKPKAETVEMTPKAAAKPETVEAQVSAESGNGAAKPTAAGATAKKAP